VCKRCDGYRLNDEALAVKANATHIRQIVGRSVKDGIDFIDNISLSAQNEEIAEPILKEIDSRLSFLRNVGLDYLTLNRKSGTLSGGEAQRIRLATQIGSR